LNSPTVRQLLTGGDRRSIGQVPRVLGIVRRDPRRIRDLAAGLTDADPLVRMRSADAMEKATKDRPSLLHRYKPLLLSLSRSATQPELRWHLAQLIPRLQLTAAERRRLAANFEDYLGDPSAIVRTFAMQALADLAGPDAGLRARVLPRLTELTRTGSPAMRARGRRLLAELRRGAP
jgi:hypothetical protein